MDADDGVSRGTSLSTAGAITVRNAKGQLVTQKVRVQRYVAGKRPDYGATTYESDNEDEKELQRKSETSSATASRLEQEDERLRRLQAREVNPDLDSRRRVQQHRQIIEPQVLQDSENEEEEMDEEENESNEEDEMETYDTNEKIERNRVQMELESSSDEEELDEDKLEQRRQRLRMKAREREEELMQTEEDKEVPQEEMEPSEESEESEDEDDEEEEDDEGVPRLKPVFVRKNDRRTVAEREAEEKQRLQLEIEKKRLADQRRMQTQKMVEQAIRQDNLNEKKADEGVKCDFDTDDEDSEAAYDAWKLRELKRLKRDREERDQREREEQERDRWQNMTEEERLAELKKNPKLITNQTKKSKYKFLQKYYHRGAFFLDKEDDIYKRDFNAPTLEDHFDKEVLPKVMQVKNFGMAGRTKYTHLKDQDTTSKDSPWATNKTSFSKFHQEHAGGLKQVFDRPNLNKTSKSSTKK